MLSINVGAGRHHSVILSCVAAVAFVLVTSSPGIAQDPKAQLPPDFRVPRPIADFMTIEDERTDDAAIADWNKKVRPYLAIALNAKTLQDVIPGTPLTAQKIIVETCRIRVRKLSLKSLRGQLKTTRVEVYRDVHQTARVKDVREFALKTIVEEANGLMKGHLVVRLQAVQLLSELQITEREEKGAKITPAYMYADSLPALGKILADKTQPEAVHILAAAGIERVLRESNLPVASPPSKLRIEAAEALIAALKVPGLSSWYQHVLVSALPAVGLPTMPSPSGAQEPIIAKTLGDIVADKKRPLSVRCKAVLALGKCSLPPTGLDLSLLAKSINELTYEVAMAYNSRKVTPVSGALLIQDIYGGLGGDKQLGAAGILSSPVGRDPGLQEAYKAVIPITKHALTLVNLQSPQIVLLRKIDLSPIELLIGPGAVKALTPPPAAPVR